MFGSEPRIRRPVLLLLVYGAFLVLVGVTASAQASMVTSHFTEAATNAVVGGDVASVRVLVAGDLLTGSDLTATGVPDATRQAKLQTVLASLDSTSGILHAELRRADGALVATDRAGALPAVPPAAIDRTADAAIVPLAEAGALVDDLAAPMLLRERLPINDRTGAVLGELTLWRDAGPILAKLDAVRLQVVLVTLSAAAVAAVLLFIIFRSAQKRLTRQTVELVEATRRDPLTGTYNHGALVSLLAGRMETAKATASPSASPSSTSTTSPCSTTTRATTSATSVLLTVLDVLDDDLPGGRDHRPLRPRRVPRHRPAGRTSRASSPRSRPSATRSSSAASTSTRASASRSRSVPGSRPTRRDGASLTVLLATVASTLGSAKASGGDEIRVTGMDGIVDGGAATFDVLQGLVFAVDTKDRYTKRHSEDVARYAVFLARQDGLDEATVGAVRLAGLLHDIGKIGMPDHLLRKPGALTDDEYEIVKQHVVLGDLIVRDLPDTDLIRAGIRHHHERWDGTGYVDGLAGEDIPLIARIVAVADSFSAMTTSRAYRKALDTDEAIRRLTGAAGTQLDPRLVDLFVTSLRTVADAPMPGSDPSAQHPPLGAAGRRVMQRRSSHGLAIVGVASMLLVALVASPASAAWLLAIP